MSVAQEPFHPLDESRLSGEDGAIYLLEWLGSSEQIIRRASPDDLREQRASLEETLLKAVTSNEPFPSPGRPIRNAIARCFLELYTRGDTKTLFDSLQELLKVLADTKSTTAKEAQRVAAIYCIGELMGCFGSQVMSLMTETTVVTLKLCKSSGSVILRYHAILALAKALHTAKRALTDVICKDVIKQAKGLLSDKSLPMQRVATEVLLVMFPFSEGQKSMADVESLLSICVKQFDSADQQTRFAHAKLVAHILSYTQQEYTVIQEPVKTAKKAPGVDQEQDDEITAPHSVPQEVKRLLSPQEMLTLLSAYLIKPNTSRRTYIGLFDCYAALFNTMGPEFVENNYAVILSQFMVVYTSPRRETLSRHDLLFLRTLIGTTLRDLIGIRTLSEQAQIAAIQELSSAYLKRWPAMMPGQNAPDPHVLVIVLTEVMGLLKQLGNAPVPVQEALAEPLVTLLTHPSHTIRVTAAATLKMFCFSTPLRLPKVLLDLVGCLQNDLSGLTSPAVPSNISTRTLGHAYGLAALLSVIPQRPLYVSYDISANVFYVAVQLLKRAGEHEIGIAQVEIEVAWTLISSLMALGPNFVRAHLPQLLVLWRNALPKPTTKDGLSVRSEAEWTFLFAARENALRAVYSFLHHNSPTLVTADVSRRIMSLLSNALQFINTITSQKMESEAPSLTMTEALFRTRVFQCFSTLGASRIGESVQTSLLQMSIAFFASPEGYAGSSVQAAIASSSGSMTNIWHTIDNYAYGITDIDLGETSNEYGIDGNRDWLNRDTIHAKIDALSAKPILRALEHDPLVLCHGVHVETTPATVECPPAATAAVNAALHLFAELLPLQDVPSTSRVTTQLLDAVATSRHERNLGRKAAARINTAVAIVLALRHASSHSKAAPEGLAHPQVSAPLAEFLKDVLVDGDAMLRQAASEAMGRLASLAGTSFLTSQIKTLVNEVVSNRDPYGRAGCALAFGAVYSHVGGLAAGPLLKTTVHVLMSLINDPHPVVHFWALRALSKVIDAASLAYASYVPSTLGLFSRVYMLETHEPEGGTLNYVNMSGDLPIYQALCQAIDAVITVVGPDIQESRRTRSLVLDLVHQLIHESDDGIRVEAIRCTQHLLIFAPEHIDVPKLVTQFRGYLSSSRRPLKIASINALYQLVQKDVMTISKLGGDRLVEELFSMLDEDPSIGGVRNVITSWLQQTVVYNPSAWIDLCQRIMSRIAASHPSEAQNIRRDIGDDEGQSLSIGAAGDSFNTERSGLTARWRTQLFALQCLHQICTTISQSRRREHVDLAFARSQGLPLRSTLVSRIADLIKIAFTASAAHVMEIRLAGLAVLRDVIEIFARSPDPDYEDALILEQYQAPITSALTPAFSADSTPEILASAIEACAVFVGSGVVKDVSRMGRILKLLSSALEQCQDSGLLRLGEASELGPNASIMLRIATLTAWAELQIASASHQYLLDVVAPHTKALASLWIASLRDYASIRAGTELLDDSSTGSVDLSYSGLGKEVLLPYYQDSWPTILEAVTVTMERGESAIQLAMDGISEGNTPINLENRDQPATFFFVIFGLVFEALSTSSPDSGPLAIKGSTVALKALKYLARIEYCGSAFRDTVIFEELANLFYRVALTESVGVQTYLVDVLASLAQSISQHSIKDDNYPQTHCLRICAYILRRVTSSPRDGGSRGQTTPDEKVKLINAAFDAFSLIAIACDRSRDMEYRAVAISLYNDLLRDEITEGDLVGPTLQSLKKLIEHSPNSEPDKAQFERVIHGILSACLVNIDAMRGREGPVCQRKIKNNILAAVLILTVVPQTVKVSRAAVEHTCFLISQQLSENNELSLTAAHCAKTLTMGSASGNPILGHSAKLLLPGMIECIAGIAASDGSQIDRETQTLAEIWKAFAAILGSTPEDLRPRILSVLLPTMVLLLNPTHIPPSPTHVQTVTKLLSFAASSPHAFKEATSKLDIRVREILEASVRQALGGNKAAVNEANKPQISLRAF